MERHAYRPAHIHFLIKAEGFKTLTTHIFDQDCPKIAIDTVFAVKESLKLEFKEKGDGSRYVDQLDFRLVQN